MNKLRLLGLASSLLFATSAFAQSNPMTVGLVLLHQDIYMSDVAKGVEQANPGGRVLVQNYASDAAKEVQAMEDLVTRGVDVIITTPLDGAGSVPAIKRAAEAGIPVICFNTCINEEDMKKYVKAFILSDQGGLGSITGKFAANYLKEKGMDDLVIGILTCDSFDICRQRRAGFFGELDSAGINYKIVADQEAYSPDKSVPAAENILTANPDINVLWSENDGGTIGLLRGVASNGLGEKISVFGTDMSPQLAGYIVSGELLATAGQDGIATGVKAMELAQMLAAGEDIGELIQVVQVAPYTVNDLDVVKAYIEATK